MRKQITILSIATMILAGCATPRQMTLFAGGDPTVKVQDAPQYIVEVGDVLKIEFTAINMEAVQAYNSAGTDYIVAEDGTINVPSLGKIVVVGKTVGQLVEMLTKLAKVDVYEPVVRVQIKSAVVTVLGEVCSPSRLSAVTPITLTEALGQVGGLTHNAKCNNILVMRREKGVLQHYRINLLTDEILTSPCYYLQKGDVVYVSPLHAK